MDDGPNGYRAVQPRLARPGGGGLKFDLVLRGGTILDGSGGEPFVADVGIRGDTIAAIGPSLDAAAAETIDASGMLVTPGFVDVHTHYDGQVIWDDRLNPSSGHGVTTVLMGNCGVGFAPCRAASRDKLLKLMEGVEDIPGVVMAEGLSWDWESYGEYLDAVARRPHDINVASLLPHAPLRVYVMGDRAIAGQDASPAEIAEMARLAEQAVEAGALGFSTSRSFFHRGSDGAAIPTLSAGADELLGIAKAMRGAGASLLQIGTDYSNFTNIENEYRLIADVARESGCSLSLPLAEMHSAPGKWREVMALIARSNSEGVKVSAQGMPRQVGMLFGLNLSMHPFSLSPTYQAIADLPLYERIERMRDPLLKARIIAEDPVEGTSAQAQFIRRLEDMYEIGDPLDYEPSRDTAIAARALRLGVPPLDLAYDLLLDHGDQAAFLVPLANYASGNLDTAYEIFNHPNSIPGLGDGGAHYGVICDASYSTFMLTHWVRDRTRGPRLPLPVVIRAMTRDSAEEIGLRDRGRVAPGYRADLNVIDFDRLKLHPPVVRCDLPAGGRRLTQRADGYVATIVNGQVAYLEGQPTGVLPGRLVRGVTAAPGPVAAAGLAG